MAIRWGAAAAKTLEGLMAGGAQRTHNSQSNKGKRIGRVIKNAAGAPAVPGIVIVTPATIGARVSDLGTNWVLDRIHKIW